MAVTEYGIGTNDDALRRLADIDRTQNGASNEHFTYSIISERKNAGTTTCSVVLFRI